MTKNEVMLEESDGEAYSGHNRSCTRAFFALAYRPTKRAPDAVMGKMAKQAMGKLVGFTFMAIGLENLEETVFSAWRRPAYALFPLREGTC